MGSLDLLEAVPINLILEKKCFNAEKLSLRINELLKTKLWIYQIIFNRFFKDIPKTELIGIFGLINRKKNSKK